MALIKDDDTLHRLGEDGRLAWDNNNWVEPLVFDSDGNNISDFTWDNVLDNNILDAFKEPGWVKML